MPTPDEAPQRDDPTPASDPVAPPERRFLNRLLDHLADAAPDVHAAFAEANADLIQQEDGLDAVRDRARAALTGASGPALSPAQLAVTDAVRAELKKRREALTVATTDATNEELPGILTSMTRHLSPEKALELYRKIAPVVVYQILDRVNQSTSLRVVHRIVDHLCSSAVQEKLRSVEHVRDAMIDELRSVLGADESAVRLTRAELLAVLEESGAMNDLIAMANCLKLSASKAG
jgi:hypothetical protein